MIEIVINYDEENKTFKLYEPTTDTLLLTTSLGDMFIQLNDFLREKGMIATDILSTLDITYHIDSRTFLALIESNVSLIKQLNQSPSGFMISSQKFGMSNTNNNVAGNSQSTGKESKSKGRRGIDIFSNSSFRGAYKKFGWK